MNSLLALVGIITACALAHSPGVRDATNNPMSIGLQPPRKINRKPARGYLVPSYHANELENVAKEESASIPNPRPQMPASDWLNEEINRINQMPDESDIPKWRSQASFQRILHGSSYPYGNREPYLEYPQLALFKEIMTASNIPRKHAKVLYPTMKTTTEAQKFADVKSQKEEPVFAYTPRDPEYFEPTEKVNSSYNFLAGIPEGQHEGGGLDTLKEVMPRQIRQNPNHGRTKTIVAEDLDKLRDGLSKQQMRIPVSLIPTNLKWLKITKDISANDSNNDPTEPKHIRVLNSEYARGTVYAVGIAASVGTVFTLAVLGLAFGWYIISKRAKAAADVDYPAYGVTGPTADISGDRNLARSAQIYHYQHQKQQIIAMERMNMDQRDGSNSDPESEENEEGDYTVYECPGFATTGDLEVENPLFNEESAPAAIGMVEVVKPQPKE